MSYVTMYFVLGDFITVIVSVMSSSIKKLKSLEEGIELILLNNNCVSNVHLRYMNIKTLYKVYVESVCKYENMDGLGINISKHHIYIYEKRLKCPK